MRSGLVAAGLVLALLLSGLATGSHAPGAPAAPAASGPRGPDANPGLPFALGALNATTPGAPSSPASAGAPTSAIPMTPDPTPPATTPSVLYFLNASQNCCVIANFTAPVGTWGLVELRYTGQAVGGVYDSSFRAYIDQVQVLFGTTPEYGQWNVTRDVTPYASLLNGTFNFTFLLAAATVGGYFLTSVSLWFYPVPAGEAAPVEPNDVIPLFHRVFVSTGTPTVYANATVPENVVNATLELWTYAEDADEFWYSEKPAFRAMYVAVDGQALAAVTPFPYINTGGNDPFAWRPITAAFTISDKPYDLNLTGALGLLEGTHAYEANVSGVASGANWLIGGALLLYTSPLAGPATLASYASSVPRAVSSSTSARAQSTASASYAYASSWSLGNASATAATFLNVSFSSVLTTPTGWSNLTLSEGWTLHGASSDASGVSDWVDRASFTVAMDNGGTFLETSNTGGGYPIYGNFTTDFLGLRQEWNETTSLRSTPLGGGLRTLDRDVDNLLLGGNNIYAGTEELTGPNAAVLLSVTFIQSETADELRLSASGTTLPYLFDHLVVGSAYQPPGPNNAESVTTNRILSPVASRVVATPSVLDVGGSVTFVVNEVGGTSPYTLVYSGLPPGCASVNAGTLECAPTAPGLYVVVISVSDAGGISAPVASAVVQVNPSPTVTVALNSSALEVGATGELSAVVSGGTAPFSCEWTLPASPPYTGDCSGAVAWSPASVGTSEINLTLTDATGRQVNASLSVSVVPPPQVSIWPEPTSNLTVGETRVLTANVTGGVGPFAFRWFLNGALAQSGPNSTWGVALSTAGSYSLSVTVTDAQGGSASSASVYFNVTAKVLPPPTSGGTGAGSTNDLLLGLGLGIAVGAAAGAAAVLLLRRRRTG